MNTRSKYIHIGNIPISITRIMRYINANDIKSEIIQIESLLDTNVLHHWVHDPYSINHSVLLYDRFSIRELAAALGNMDKIDTSIPVLLMDDRLIDGVHRVLKCQLSGISQIEAYKLTTTDFLNIINRKYKRR